ncbi:alpha/beta hydrolase [Acidimicrobiia bacterium]|nr:alpha/beta hydrolase [Acidimicrobiaceae bacterium]MDA8813375.1 alpha/beta hydrolase [Candidatus Actinomarina sp.]MDA9209914.1 alpha/beta hydrolase [Acidimicrobiia bacterium]MDA9844667.1 alpha/beta hydrolase [Acidimicrobiia bacterium]MDB2368341.1 alpha/beta hydrolase [Candidatus Actinomarina sp.]
MKKIFYSLGIFLAIALLGIGWYFSGLIYESGLNPEFTETESVGTAEDRVVVDSITSKSIKLNVEEEQWGVMLENGIYGIIGQNGDAVIGKILNTNGNIIERELLQINGSLVTGDRIAGSAGLLLDDNTGIYKILGTSGWSGQATQGVYTPKSVVNIEYEDIFYQSDIGQFPAYLTSSGDDGVVIFVHGFRGDYSREVFAQLRAKDLMDMGFRSMIISYRNDRGLPKDPSGIFQYGVSEWKDIDAAIDEARKISENVVLWGISGGGGPVSSWIQNTDDISKVSGIIYEAPVISFWESVEVNGAARFPWLPQGLFSYFKIVTELRYGVDFDSMDFRDAVINSDIPVLLFHGDDDEWVPVEMSDLIAESRNKNFTYIRSENVGHVTSWNADPENYVLQMSEFLSSLK